jgi:hypothetical protein
MRRTRGAEKYDNQNAAAMVPAPDLSRSPHERSDMPLDTGSHRTTWPQRAGSHPALHRERNGSAKAGATGETVTVRRDGGPDRAQ